MAAYLLRAVPSRRSVCQWLVRAGFAVHTCALVPLMVKSGNIPINTVFESFVFLLWCMALVGLAIDQVYKLPMMSAFLLPLLAILSAIAACFVDDTTRLPPGLSVLWQTAHAVPIFLAFALFAGAFVASLLYLIEQRNLRAKSAIPLLSHLPSLETLDSISAEAIRWGFTPLTVGIIAGAVWLRDQQLLAAPWYKDLKVLGGAATWIVYAGLVHLRLRTRQHGKRNALLTVLSFAFVLATFVGAFLAGSQHAFKPAGAASTSSQPRAVQHRT